MTERKKKRMENEFYTGGKGGFLNFFHSPLKEMIDKIFEEEMLNVYGWNDITHLWCECIHDWGINDTRNTYELHITFGRNGYCTFQFSFSVYHNYGLYGVKKGLEYIQYMQGKEQRENEYSKQRLNLHPSDL